MKRTFRLHTLATLSFTSIIAACSDDIDRTIEGTLDSGPPDGSSDTRDGSTDVDGATSDAGTDAREQVTYAVGGVVTGLSGSGLTLTNNGGDTLALSSNGSFSFGTHLATGTAFAVAVATQPTSPSQTCVASGESGTVGAGDVTTVAINCTTDTFTVGGTISGLTGSLVLRKGGNGDGGLNVPDGGDAGAFGVDEITATANGSFAFPTPVTSGTSYAVAIAAQPAGQHCELYGPTDAGTPGVGTVGGTNVTSLSIRCVSTPTLGTLTANATACGPFAGPLTWSETKDATYHLEVTKSGGTTTAVDLPAGTLSYTPATPFDVGTWSWQVTAIVSGTSSNVASSSFTVSSPTASQFAQTTTADFASNALSNTIATSDHVELGFDYTPPGNGSGGAYAPTINGTLAGGTYNFTSFTIPNGVTITVTGTNPLVVNVQGTASIAGNLVASGSNGNDGVTFSTFGTGGVGVAGGANGGDGIYVGGPSPGVAGSGTGGGGGGTGWSSGGGGGYAAAGGTTTSPANGIGGASYGDAALAAFVGGSGGGGGSGGNNCGSGGGGAGGGAVRINAATLAVGGSILANGGNGGTDGNGNCGAGGGGSGGSIWLQAPVVTVAGTIYAKGGTGGSSTYASVGGAGSDGRIRIDSGTAVSSGVAPAPGYTGSIAHLTSGTVASPSIAPSLCAWGTLSFNSTIPSNQTTLTVDVLDSAGNLLATNVSSGTNLGALSAISGKSALKLRANLGTSATTSTPALLDWTLAYTSY